MAETPPEHAPAERPQKEAPAAPVARRKRAKFFGSPQTDDGVVDVWLMSYADMVTLLMTVFVILVLLAGTNKQTDNGGPGKYDGVRGFLNNIFELRAMSPYADESDFVVVGRDGNMTALTPEQRSGLTVVKKQDLEHIQRRLDTLENVRHALDTSKLGDYVRADAAGDGIRIDIPSPIMFGAGVSDIDGRGTAVLRALVPIFASGDFSIVVEGHTDNSPVSDPTRYPSNWELSAARASAVVRFLVDAGIDPKRLAAAGYGDAQPIVSNTSEANRAQNRRVSFLLRY